MTEHARTRRHRKPMLGSKTAAVHSNLQHPPARPVPVPSAPGRAKVDALRARFERRDALPASAKLSPGSTTRPAGAYAFDTDTEDDLDADPARPASAYAFDTDTDTDTEDDLDDDALSETTASDVAVADVERPSEAGARPRRRAWAVSGIMSSYADEQTVQRPDLIKALGSLAEEMRVLYAAREYVRNNPPDRATFRHARSLLKMDPTRLNSATQPDKHYRAVQKKSPERFIRYLETRYDFCASKLHDQGVAVSPQGELPDLTARLVRYDQTKEEQTRSRVVIKGGLLLRSDGSDTPVDTTNSSTFFSGRGVEIFVMSVDGDLHMSSHRIGERQHSSLLAAQDTAMSGEISVKDGKIVSVTNKSGHYMPNRMQLVQFLHFLAKDGVSLDFKIGEGWGVDAGRAADVVEGRDKSGHTQVREGWSYLKTEAAQRALSNLPELDLDKAGADGGNSARDAKVATIDEVLAERGYRIIADGRMYAVKDDGAGGTVYTDADADAVFKSLRGEIKKRIRRKSVVKHTAGKETGWAFAPLASAGSEPTKNL